MIGGGKGGPSVSSPPSSLPKGGKGGGSEGWGGVQSANFHSTPTHPWGILCASPVNVKEWTLTTIFDNALSTEKVWHANGVMPLPKPVRHKRPSGVEVPEEQASGNPDSSTTTKRLIHNP